MIKRFWFDFSAIPCEILFKILLFLDLPDFSQLSLVSPLFRDTLNSKHLWRLLTRRNFAIRCSDANPKEVYKNFLRHYSKLVGVYRLYSFFSKHLLHIRLDPGDSRQVVLRTWSLEEEDPPCKGRDVMRIRYQGAGIVSAQCLEERDEEKIFCFNDHVGEQHHFSFHLCKGNLFFNPLKTDREFLIRFCPDDGCLDPRFVEVVCCQKIENLGSPFRDIRHLDHIPIIKPGIFSRYHENSNQNRSLLGSETFFLLDISTQRSSPVLSLTQFTSQHQVSCASLLMPCDLANMSGSHGNVLLVDLPKLNVDHMPGRRFTWCTAGIRDNTAGLQRVRHWPKLYKTAYFDVNNTVFIVLFNGNTVGCFFSDGTFDLLERFDFYSQ